MAEHRRFADLNYGHAGQLTYIPREDPQNGPGQLHTRRFTSDFPHFRIIGSSAELYPPSKSPVPQAPSRLSQGRRLQKRWLLKSHPEAFMGGSAFQDALTNDLKRFGKVDETPNTRPLLAMGQITDVRDPVRVTGTTVLAVATGQSGELLRLTRIQESMWKWGQNKDALLNLSVIDPEDQEEEATWASDGLPISQIKFATSLTRYNPARWLIVQKQTSTVILQPEYHNVPIADSQPEQTLRQAPSRIDPNPLLTLSHHQTGGNAHSDVAFNPGSQTQQAQLVVIDECGYWTVWNVLGTWQVAKHTLRLSLYKCGHIWEGLSELPKFSTTAAERHGLLFVGQADADDFWSVQSFKAGSVDAVAARSQHVLLWNRERFEIFDLELDRFIPRLLNFVGGKEKPDWILDIQPSPVNREHVFILTGQYLFWVEISCQARGTRPPSGPRILLTCPLSTYGRGDERMTVCRTSGDDPDTSIVFIYTSRSKQMSTYWFTWSAEHQLPEWHRDIMALPESEDAQRFDLHLLKIFPARLQLFKGTATNGPGSDYQRLGVQYFQGNILGEDLSLRYCMFAGCSDPALEITLPTTRIGWSRPGEDKQWRKKRKQLLRHMDNTFVLPDGMTDLDLESLGQPRSRTERLRHIGEDKASSRPRPIQLKLDHMCRTVRDSLDEPEGDIRVAATTLDAVRTTLEHGIATGSLPLMTWPEAAAEAGVRLEPDEPTVDPENAIQSLFDMTTAEISVIQLRRHSPKEPSEMLISLSDIRHHLSDLWLDPVADKLPKDLQQRRRVWVLELARDLFLSTCGVMVQDVPLLGPVDPDAMKDTQRSVPSSTSIPSSPAASQSIASSPPVSTATSPPDAAFQRLQLLSPSLRPGKLGAIKQASILAYWPTERGVDTKEYISSVAAASDRQFDDARARLRKMEAKRKAQSEKYRRPAFMRQGFQESSAGEQAPAHALSSQLAPPSSQTQGVPVTMSQPVSGAFGDRKKVKKGKRKSGFR